MADVNRSVNRPRRYGAVPDESTMMGGSPRSFIALKNSCVCGVQLSPGPRRIVSILQRELLKGCDQLLSNQIEAC